MDSVDVPDIAAAEAAFEGRNFFVNQEFELASESFSLAAQKSGRYPEYLWAELLSEYGIKYCKTEDDSRYTVNFWKWQHPEELLTESKGFAALIKSAATQSAEAVRFYKREAEEIDRGLAQIQRLEEQDMAYDIFLSFKDTDAFGRQTPERKLCEGLYLELTEKGYKVFFAPRTMYGKLVTDFEGYIYTALKTSELMIIAASSKENLNAHWVESEWQRFLNWNGGEDYRLVTCTLGEMRPDDYPEELSRIQHGLCARADQVEEMAILKWFSAEIENCFENLDSEQYETEFFELGETSQKRIVKEMNSEGIRIQAQLRRIHIGSVFIFLLMPLLCGAVKDIRMWIITLAGLCVYSVCIILIRKSAEIYYRNRM